MTDRIKELRIKIFGTQSDMAKALRLKPNSIGAYESGISFLKPEKIAYLIENYRINANWLLSGKGNMLLDEKEMINDEDKINELEKKIEKLKIENELLKELINKK